MRRGMMDWLEVVLSTNLMLKKIIEWDILKWNLEENVKTIAYYMKIKYGWKIEKS